MKIERDKWYVTRGGYKVRVVCVDAPGDHPVVGVSDTDGANFYTAEGLFYFGGGETDLDLVAEHREPARVWVNIYESGALHGATTEEAAKRAAVSGATRIAVEFVEVVK